MAFEILREIQVDCAPDHLWTVLTDVDRYPEWNPYVIAVRGELVPGQMIEMDIAAPDRDVLVGTAVVAVVDPPHHLRFEWERNDVDLFDGSSEFHLHADPIGCRVEHRQVLSGELAPGIEHRLGDRMVLGIEMMLAALKARAER
jgi:uncharacterized protein YndB with AHSA1/START domain